MNELLEIKSAILGAISEDTTRYSIEDLTLLLAEEGYAPNAIQYAFDELIEGCQVDIAHDGGLELA